MQAELAVFVLVKHGENEIDQRPSCGAQLGLEVCLQFSDVLVLLVLLVLRR